MAFEKKVECPSCGEDNKFNIGASNPLECEQCSSKFNLVTRSVPIRIDIDPEFADKVIAGAHQVGAYTLEKFEERFKPWEVVPGEKGECPSCGREVKLTMRKDGQRYCSRCGKREVLGGSEIRREVKEHFYPEVPRKTLIGRAFKRAKSMFQTWLSNNWNTFAVRKKLKNQIQECKNKGKQVELSEDPELSHIREIWRGIRKPISPLKFFEIYWEGRAINKSNRKERRERLKNLSEYDEVPEKKRKFPDLAYQVAKPICADCDQLQRYEFGWECKGQRALDNWLSIDDVPSFPDNVAYLPNGSSYQITKEKIKDLRIWEHHKSRDVEIINADWLDQRYNHSQFTSEKYPQLRRDEPGEYYLEYPKRDTVEIQPGSWTSIIGYGPTRTWVVSINGDQQEQYYFEHGEVVSIKEYYQSQRKEAGDKEIDGYFDKDRDKEWKGVDLALHTETKEIGDYLADFPGRVIILNMQKENYKREEYRRKHLNQLLSQWTEGIFREHMKYKAELAGLEVEERDFDLSEKPTCPECGLKFGENWQDLIIIGEKGKEKCWCGEKIDLVLEAAKTQIKTDGF